MCDSRVQILYHESIMWSLAVYPLSHHSRSNPRKSQAHPPKKSSSTEDLPNGKQTWLMLMFNLYFVVIWHFLILFLHYLSFILIKTRFQDINSITIFLQWSPFFWVSLIQNQTKVLEMKVFLKKIISRVLLNKPISLLRIA